ncbi:uncharacterized protein HMPREF1541_04306 [Cyphellophora europaea CBS 101466]|uniref:Heterokaryon incompatibility domain-containing protein n=1 Tax=Cyphellophora europaea (strain CBS 101466) TaxID=1220924 RepID=W2RU51_CYPE1|nr:uncharacterized protein HMPREF1541_04306 [Cyphellophora europaea CBS 101466]ETN40031.1 hypothetical protein HMPREF1541_04306 [Cyphellophora europaea CBS 101466]
MSEEDPSRARAVVIAAAGSTNDDSNISFAGSWLSKCLTTHPACNAISTHNHWYPSRLLRLDRARMGISIRLQDCKVEVPTGPYISLSHRWGQANFMTLNVKNIDTLKINIALCDLSKTFQDAVHATLSLGYNYLWVDSLCIIQDSEDDWLNEASTMDKVYQNALFTISATNARSLTDGLGSMRYTDHVSCLYRDVRFDSGSQATKRAQILHTGLWEGLVLHTPLNYRAWILQERLLSPRILHFGLFQLAWECSELEACQTYPDGILPEMRDSWTLGGASRLALLPRRLSDHPPAKDEITYDWHHAWHSIVERYTQCRLIKPSDMFIALSGIASNIRVQIQDTYLAGLWKSSFVEDLGWQSTIPAGGHRPEAYYAPSWSWAAIDRPVSYRSRQEGIRHAAELIDYNITLLDENNPTGPVRGASATLKGKLIEFQWDPRDREADGASTHPWKGPMRLAVSAEGLIGDETMYFGANEIQEDCTADILQKAHGLVLRQEGQEFTGARLDGILLDQVSEALRPTSTRRISRRIGHFSVSGERCGTIMEWSRDATVTLI